MNNQSDRDDVKVSEALELIKKSKANLGEFKRLVGEGKIDEARELMRASIGNTKELLRIAESMKIDLI